MSPFDRGRLASESKLLAHFSPAQEYGGQLTQLSGKVVAYGAGDRLSRTVPPVLSVLLR